MSPKDIADLEMKKSCQFEIKGNNPPPVSLENFMSGTYIYEVELNNRWRQQSTMMLIK